MSRNQLVQKYSLTFEIEFYATSAADGFARGCELQRNMLDYLAGGGVASCFDDRFLPSAGIHGAPHVHTLDGWRCVYTLRLL